MKKLYTTERYKKRNLSKIRKGNVKRNVKYNPYKYIPKSQKTDIKLPVIAPEDFRLIDNTEACLAYFKELRSTDFVSEFKGNKFIKSNLNDVKKIDYASISILSAISDDLKYKNRILQLNLPTDKMCNKFFEDSGFLKHMYDSKGNRFQNKTKSDLIFFEKGSGILTENDNRKISKTIKEIVNHLTGEEKTCKPLKTLILEICGNSIEWGRAEKQQWLFGVKFEKEKVILTVTDVGLGILETLRKRFPLIIKDILSIKNDIDVLKGAFNQKYGSSSKEINRNKGLPSIRINNEENKIKKLVVITNNVILHFNNKNSNKLLGIGKPNFKGTFYQWEMDKECLNNILNHGIN